MAPSTAISCQLNNVSKDFRYLLEFLDHDVLVGRMGCLAAVSENNGVYTSPT